MKAVLGSIVLSALICVVSPAADESPPSFAGFLSSRATGVMFSLRWRDESGTHFQALLRLGDRAGSFLLVEFDAKTETLVVEDKSGRHHSLRLLEAKVQEEQLTESEFGRLLDYEMEGADISSAPVLSREKAKAYYLEKVRRMFSTLGDIEVVFDIDGRTLPPQQQLTWVSDQATARAAGRILRAVVIDGKTELHEFPLRPFPIPEQMTRNLSESDWDELGLLVATNSLKLRIKRLADMPNKAPEPTPMSVTPPAAQESRRP